jgi:hypothetical protein
MAIKSIEWLGFYESAKVTAKSDWMRDEIVRIYKTPKEKVKVILPTAKTWISDIMKVYAETSVGAKET